MRNRISWLCIVAGVVMLFASAGAMVKFALEDIEAHAESERIRNAVEERIPDATVEPVEDVLDRVAQQDSGLNWHVPDFVLNPDMPMPRVEIDGVDYVGTVSVPSVGIEMPVSAESTYAVLKKSPVSYRGSIYRYDMIIAGHNYTSHFGGLWNVSVGDDVSFKDMDGNVFEYRVSAIETLHKTEYDRLMRGGWDLTLLTCTAGGEHRVIVRCELLRAYSVRED